MSLWTCSGPYVFERSEERKLNVFCELNGPCVAREEGGGSTQALSQASCLRRSKLQTSSCILSPVQWARVVLAGRGGFTRIERLSLRLTSGSNLSDTSWARNPCSRLHPFATHGVAPGSAALPCCSLEATKTRRKQIRKPIGRRKSASILITKGSLSYLSSPCFSKHVLQSGVGIVHCLVL